MICRHDLEAELKRYPGFIKEAIKAEDFSLAFQRQVEMDTIKWILEGDGK